MQDQVTKILFSRFVSRILIATAALGASSRVISAQQPQQDSAAAQREAMRKLQFLVGHWSGPVTIMRGPGAPLRLTQTEEVAYKLDGLVLLIEGKSTGADGKAQFEAMATIAYDDATHTYRIRAYNDGHYVDAELVVKTDGFSWGFAAGPVNVQNMMQLTSKGEWHETTDVKFGDNPPRRSVEMMLEKQGTV